MSHENAFGQQVRQRRRALDLTQEELARRVGCAAVTLRKIEAGDLRPSQQIAERLAMALAIPLDERADFVRQARSVQPGGKPIEPTPTPQVMPEEIGAEDLSGRAIRGYQLGEKIGAGAFGAVYRAVQPLVEREVAVKIILPQYANHPDFIRRFEAEAQLVARLEHPHIVPLYDYWREPGVAYLVMRLLRGGNVHQLLERGALALDDVARLMEQIGGALHTAHRAGVVHRDLKPSNVLLDEDCNAYLADFGIAKNLGNPNLENLTQAGMMIGSPAYMSPEQINEEPIRPQADIYSLGVMLYELLTGARPFLGPTPLDLIQQHLYAPLPPLASNKPGLPAAFEDIIARATNKDPLQRYAEVDLLLADFKQVMQTGRLATTTIELAAPVVPIEIVNPYKGLRPFAEADAPDFFGREALTQQLLARLGEGDDLVRFLAVIGPSGSGKSSVVGAGLIPALRRGGLPHSENWFIVEVLPGPHPLEELEAALLRVAVNPPESLLAQIKEDRRGLLRAVNRCLPAGDDVELVLVLDQFEEVFTLVADEAERAHLLDCLVAVVLDERSRVRVVVTLRADFIDKPLRYVDFSELLKNRSELVLPLTPDEMEQAIGMPAERAGLQIEPGLMEAIVGDVVDQPGALPLLQYALTELVEQHSDHTLTKVGYQAIGGVRGALGRRAEEVFQSLSEEQQATARQIFLRLVTLGEGTEDVRRRVLRSELESISNQQSAISNVLDAFGRARLLTFDRDLQTRGPTVEVAHEALLREWPRLREWLNDSRADVRLQRLLANETVEWLNANRDASYLLQGARLAQFEGWVQTTSIALTHDERAFLDASVAERQAREAAEAEQQRRELESAQKLAETERARADSEQRRAEEQMRSANRLRTRNRVIVGAGLVALLLAVLAGAFALRAEGERKLSFSRELAAAALNNVEVDPERGVLLALQAVSIAQTSQALTALHRTVPALHLVRTLYGPTHIINSVAVSLDGKYIAAGSVDQTVNIWDAQTGQSMHVFSDHTGSVSYVAFSPDGQSLAGATGNGNIKIWETISGRERLTLSMNNGWVNVVAFSPDGKLLASGWNDGTIRIWDAASGQLLSTLVGHTQAGSALFPGQAFGASGVAFAPGGPGRRLVSTGYDGKIILWDLTELSLPTQVFSVQTGEINGVAFSPDGNYLATAGLNGNVEVWDAASGAMLGQNILTLKHEQPVYSIAFSPDGKRLAAIDGEKMIVWEANSGQKMVTLYGKGQGIVFTPDGKYLVVGVTVSGAEKVGVQIWDTGPDHELLALECPNGAGSVVYDQGGKRLFTGCLDGTLIFWDSTSGEALHTLHEHTDNVVNLALSPDGKRLATASWDGTAKVLDSESGRVLTTLQGHSDQVWGVAFSPDGTRLATSSFDGTAKIWDATTGQELLTFHHTLQVVTIAFSPDGKRLATGSWATNDVYIWDVASGQKLATLSMPGGVNSLAFSPNGRRLAISAQLLDPTIWDVSSPEGQIEFTLKGHAPNVMKIAFNPDGSQLATVGWDGQAKLWDAATGQELLTLAKQKVPLLYLAFSPDGAYLTTAGMDGLVQVYTLRLADLLTLARSRLSRSLTLEECQQYLHSEACPNP